MSDTRAADNIALAALAIPPSCNADGCWAPAEFFVRKRCCPATTAVMCGVHLVVDAEWIAGAPFGVGCQCGAKFRQPIRHGDLHITTGITQ